MATNLRKRPTVTEGSLGTSIARSGFSFITDAHRPSPDPLKLSRDVRDQLKDADLPFIMKNRIALTTKEAEMLIRCHKALGPYLRRTLVDLRHTVKKKTGLPEDKESEVEEQMKLFTEQLKKIKKNKHKIIEAAEARKVESARQRQIFQVFIDDKIRIYSTNNVIDMPASMGDVQKFKRFVKELTKLGNSSSFATSVKEDLADVMSYINSMLGMDGLHALKLRHDIVLLRNAVVQGADAEEEVKLRLTNMKRNVDAITIQCEIKRDQAEHFVNDITKTMLDMDKSINDKKALLRAQKTGTNG